jgi:hypothetical protein
VATLQEDVLGLDVSVDDAALVRVLQRVRHLARQLHRVVHRELPLSLEPSAERLALHERHHVVQLPVCAAGIEQRQDVRVLERRGKLDLLEESLWPEHRTELRVQDLDCHLPAVPNVLRQVHGGHAAASELALDVVTAREHGAKLRERRRHQEASARDTTATKTRDTTPPPSSRSVWPAGMIVARGRSRSSVIPVGGAGPSWRSQATTV